MALIALVGAAGGLAAQAARRTDTAFARDLSSGKATNAIVSVNSYDPDPAKSAATRQRGMRVLDDLERSPVIATHGGLSVVIGIVLALFLVATLIHALVSTMRRRVTDLAVLRALGCTPRQLSSTLRWQGFMLTAASVVVGIPVGLVAGRFAWQAFASNIGIAPDGVVPILALSAAGAALFAIAMLVASVVGQRVPSALRRQPG